MQYIQFTHVDSVTGISVAAEPAQAGPKHPNIIGLQFQWARESCYPTSVPDFFGICPDDSDTNIDGVIAVWSQTDYEQMRSDEMEARKRPIKEALATLDLQRIRPLAEGDTEHLENLNAQIAALREQLRGGTE